MAITVVIGQADEVPETGWFMVSQNAGGRELHTIYKDGKWMSMATSLANAVAYMRGVAREVAKPKKWPIVMDLVLEGWFNDAPDGRISTWWRSVAPLGTPNFELKEAPRFELRLPAHYCAELDSTRAARTKFKLMIEQVED